MKKPYRSKFLRISNLNNSFLNRYKRRYSIGIFKYTIPNKEKLEFFKQKKEEKKLAKYYEYKSVIDELNKNRKNKNPILTIILLTYNHKTTIEKCIQSLLSQETKYDYIIKICDDASTDGTTKICFEYAKKYPEKIEYILQKKNTNSIHFGYAIRSLNTKYWSYIDGDDWWITNDKIEKAINFLEQNPEYAVYGTNNYFLEKGNKIDYKHTLHKAKNIKNPISIGRFYYLHPSTRIHRHVVDYSKEYKKMLLSDMYLYLTTLDKGYCYFEDKKTSVYNYTHFGVISKYNENQREFWKIKQWYAINSWLDFKYDKEICLFVNKKEVNQYKKIFGTRLGWKLYAQINKLKLIKKDITKLKQDYKYINKRQRTKEEA